MHIRPAQLQDLNQLLEIENQSFDCDQISARSFKKFLTSRAQPGLVNCWIIEQNQQLAGYALVLYRRNSKIARIYSLAIRQNYRGKGLAKMLIQRLISYLTTQQLHEFQQLSLEVNQQNQAAIAIYQQLGFQIYQQLDNYYQNGDQAWRMRKSLNINP